MIRTNRNEYVSITNTNMQQLRLTFIYHIMNDTSSLSVVCHLIIRPFQSLRQTSSRFFLSGKRKHVLSKALEDTWPYFRCLQKNSLPPSLSPAAAKRCLFPRFCQPWVFPRRSGGGHTGILHAPNAARGNWWFTQTHRHCHGSGRSSEQATRSHGRLGSYTCPKLSYWGSKKGSCGANEGHVHYQGWKWGAKGWMGGVLK